MATDGLIDIHFSEAFLNYAKKATATTSSEDDSLFTIKYQSKPVSLVNSQSIGTLWSTSPSSSSSSFSSPAIHASFPSSTSKPHNFTSIPSSASNPNPSTSPEVFLIYSPTSNSYVLSPPLSPSDTLHLKPDRSTRFPSTVPRVPTNEELGKKTREFWDGANLPNPFQMPQPKGVSNVVGGDGDTVMNDSREGSEDEDEEDDGPKLANVPSYLRNPVSTGPAPTSGTEVEDFGPFSFNPGEETTNSSSSMQIDQPKLPPPTSSSSSNTTTGLVLPKKKPETPPSPVQPPPSRPRVPVQAQPSRPQFSSKIPASSSQSQQRIVQPPAPPQTSTVSRGDLASDSSSEEDDDDDADFEDVSVPLTTSAPVSSSLPSVPPVPSSNNTRSPIPSKPATNTQSSRSNNHQRLSTSLRNIIDPPSSPLKQPQPPLPSSASSQTLHRPPFHIPQAQAVPSPPLQPQPQAASRPTVSGKLPIKKRKSSLLPEDQASSDSSSSSDDDDDSSGSEEDDLEASINASMAAGRVGGKVAMSSGGKGRRTGVVPVSANGSGVGLGVGVVQGRPTISRKGLAPPAGSTQMMSNPSSGGGSVVASAVGGQGKGGRGTGATISAYDAQRLAQYGSNYPALHQRGLSNNGSVSGGGTASPVIGVGRVELESSGEDDDDDDDESASDSD